MATKNTILGTVPKARGKYTDGDTTTRWYYDNILVYKNSVFRCITTNTNGITGAPATYNAEAHTLIPKAGWEFFVDNTDVLDMSYRLDEQDAEIIKLNEYMGLNNIDYIVEKGDGYRKWNSGRLEQWGISTASSEYSAYSSTRMPVPFTNTEYMVTGSIREQLNGFMFIMPDPTDPQIIRYRVTSPTGTALTSKVAWIAEGFWK